MSNPFFPDDDALRTLINELVPTVDIRTTGIKSFTKLLAKHVTDQLQARNNGNKEIDVSYAELKEKSQFIRDELTVAINNMAAESDGEHDSDDDDDDDSDMETEGTPAKTRRSRGEGGGLSAKKKISTKLAKFLRKAGVVPMPSESNDDVKLARTAIVKGLWAYIRKHELQNPNNKKEIVLDKAMKKCFSTDKFDMFTMNRYISVHVEPFPSMNQLLAAAKKKSKEKQKQKATAKKSGKTKGKKDKKTGGQPPYRLSDDMASLLGKRVLPRPQVVSGIWAYIKSNELQNPENKREIFCDDKLSRVMDNESKVTMFSMNKYISQHMVEKVDRSEYVHED
uniref:DM2 domain-containing protein n=1 Tax=Craspedostauros australis TaxID=1486917 RepID=A0A7R9WT44_9STRA